MTPPIRMRCWTAVPRLGRYCSITGFHVSATITFIGTDGSRARSIRSSATTGCMRQSRCSFEFTEDFFLVCKKITYEPVRMSFVHRQGTFGARSQNAGC